MTKRSIKKRQRELPDATFFIDRNIGREQVANYLRTLGWSVEVHHVHFPKHDSQKEIDDTEWIYYAGKRGWPILTSDLDTLNKIPELHALLNCNVLVFMLANGQWTAEQMNKILFSAKERICRTLRKNYPPGIFKIYEKGRVDRWELSERKMEHVNSYGAMNRNPN